MPGRRDPHSTDQIGDWAGARPGLMSQVLHAREKKHHSTDGIGGLAGARTGLVTLKERGGGTPVPVGNPTTIHHPVHTLFTTPTTVSWLTCTLVVDRHPYFRRTCYLCHQCGESGPLKGWHLSINY